jgi:hypothetical protein
MSLLNIKASKKITITCSLEESTALQVDQYAAFLKVGADDVVNSALDYVFSKDSKFQQFREENKHVQAPSRLRVKKPAAAPAGAKTNGRQDASHAGKTSPPITQQT